jgi:hypothetical protein
MPNRGNGGKTDKYIWYQHNIGEITIDIPVPANIRGKDLTVKYTSKTLYVGIKGQTPIIDGEFKNLISVNIIYFNL